MKKIIFYFPYKGMGGAERVISVLANYFSENGIEVILVNDMDLNLPYYTLNENIRTVVLDENPSGVITQNIRRIRKIRSIAKEEKPDVSIAFMNLTNSRLLLSLLGTPFKRVISVRDNTRLSHPMNVKGWFEKLIYSTADGIIFQTEEQRNYYSKKVQKKSTIIINPVNDIFFHTMALHDEKTVIMVGRIDKNKRHDLGIRAFAKVSREFPDYKLKIYGQGPYQEELKKLCDNLKITDKVDFCGMENHIEHAYSHAHVFMLTSMAEGLPNTLMEAMSMGLPVISTDCIGGGARMLIENESQGIIVERNNEAELAQALRKLLANDDLRKTLGENAKKRSEAFKTDAICEQWKEYLQRI